MTELIAFDKNHNLQYEGYCKLCINKLSSIMVIEPKIEEYKMITASFNLKYAMQKNLLFVIAEFEFLDFCLVFKNEETCKKIYSFIRPQQKEVIEPNLIETRILVPVFNKIQENQSANSELIEIFAKWINVLDENIKQKYINLLNERNIYDIVFLVLQNCEIIRKNKNILNIPNSYCKKRKFSEIRDNKPPIPKMSKNNRLQSKKAALKGHSRKIYYPLFKIMPAKNSLHSLLIFDSPEMSSFYEYKKQSHKSNVYVCRRCLLNTSIMGYDENGNICVKQLDIEHHCAPLTDIHENCVELKIIKRSDYEIYENYSNTTKRLLILLDNEDRSMCHEFLWNNSLLKFVCHDCIKVKASCNNKCTAKVCNEGRKNEFLELANSNHTCQKIKYDAEKYQLCYDHILKPNFEIQKILIRNREIETLILFKKNDKSLGYIYYYSSYLKCFVCNYCRKKGKFVMAKLCQNSDGEKYVILIQNVHVCGEMRDIKSKESVLRPPQIEFMEETNTGVPKLFVFENESRKLCFIFSKGKNKNTLFCLGCMAARSVNTEKKRSVVYGQLLTDKNGCHSFQLKNSNVKHICNPRKYQPEKYQSFKTTDFFYFRQNNFSKNLYLAIRHPTDKTLYFTFWYCKSENNFVCKKCSSKKRNVSVVAYKDDNGKEFFQHFHKKHLCKPIKVTTISAPSFTIVESHEMYVKAEPIAQSNEKLNIKKVSIHDESKIIRIPNFELQPNQNGVPDGRLIICHPNDPDLYYQYCYQKDSKNYRCFKCTSLKLYVHAKLHNDAKNKKFVVLGPNEHICEPLKRQIFEIIESPNFVIYNKDEETKSAIIYTFVSSAQDYCYQYTYQKGQKCFQCPGCNRLKKKVFAYIITNENDDEECIKVVEKHICEPKKYEPEQMQVKTIPESMFLVCPNTNGVQDKMLLVFTSEEKNFIYSYSRQTHGNFFCVKCAYKKVKVTAKICNKENDKKYAELIGPEHVCAAKKFDPTKHELKKYEPKKISESMFLLTENRNGEKNKKLIVFASDKHDMAYTFYYSRKNYYQCIKCHNMKKFDVAAKLRIDENGQKYLEMNSGEHICHPHKYEPK